METKPTPQIGDIVKIVCAGTEGADEKIIGCLLGYKSSDCGKYVVIGKEIIFSDSIKNWEILKNDK